MGRIVAVVGSVIVITLGVLVGTKLSSDSISLIIGVFIGVVASLPTSVLIIWATTRRSNDQLAGAGTQRMGQMGPGQYPPVIVVNPGTGMPTTWQQPQAPVGLPAPTGGRRFDVVGEIAEEGSYAPEP
jgi:hypothetical protein